MSNSFLKFLMKHATELNTVATVLEAAVDGSTMPDDKKSALKEATQGLTQSAGNIAQYAAQAKAAGPNKHEIRSAVAAVAVPLTSALTAALVARLLTPKNSPS